MAQRVRGLQRGAALLLHHAESAAGTSSLLPACGSTGSLLQRLQGGQHNQQSGGSWHHRGWGGSSVRFASSNSKAAAVPTQSATSDDSAATTSADLASPQEYFPLPESDATEVASTLYQAFDGLEKASIGAAKQEAFFSASWCISGLDFVHQTLGTPWWVSILIFNISLRCVTFPLMVMSQKGSAKMMEFNYHLLHAKKLQEAAMKAPSQEEHNRLFQAFRNEYNMQVAKHGDPTKAVIQVAGGLVTNGIIFLSIFNAVSKLMESKAPSLTVGGAAWFGDLTSPDPFWGLPVICTLVTLAMVEYGISITGEANHMPAERQSMQRNLKWFMRAMAVMFIPAGNYVAAGTALLWASNTTFGVFQGLALRNDKFRRRVGMPTMQEMRDMNARVQAANAAAAPPAPAGTPALFSARAADTQAAAAAAPLLSNQPVAKAVKL